MNNNNQTSQPRKSGPCRCLLVGFCRLVLPLVAFLAAVPGEAQPIERVMREMQARYQVLRRLNPGHYQFTEPYLRWPACDQCNHLPAPLYPPDGFYGDLNLNPWKAVEVTTAMSRYFWGDFMSDIYPLMNHFLDTPDGRTGIDGTAETELPYFDSTTMPKPSGAGGVPLAIQPNTWWIVASAIGHYVPQLKHIKMGTRIIRPMQQGGDPADGVQWKRGQGQSLGDYGAARVNALADWDTADWLESPFGNPGYVEKTVDDGSQCWIETRRGHFFARLYQVNCKRTLYLSVCEAAEFGYREANSPPVAPLDIVRHWLDYALSEEDFLSELFGDYPGQAKPAFSGGDFEQSGVIDGGWYLSSFLVLEPLFNTAPDPICCGENCAFNIPGHVEPSVKCAHAFISLGKKAEGRSAGYLMVREESLKNLSLSKEDLYFVGVSKPAPDAWNRLVIPSAATPQAVVVVEDLENPGDGSGYTVTFLPSDSVIPAPPNPLPAFKTVTVKRTPGLQNAMSILEREGEGEDVETARFVNDPQANTWELVTGGAQGLRYERKVGTTEGALRVSTIQVRDSENGSPVTQTVEKFRSFPWGEEMVEMIEGTDDVAQRTMQWSYYEEEINPGYGQVRAMRAPGGYWEVYEYDQHGRITKVTSPFENAMLPANDIPEEPNNRKIETAYNYQDDKLQITKTTKLFNNDIACSVTEVTASPSSWHQATITVKTISDGGDAPDADVENVVTSTVYYDSVGVHGYSSLSGLTEAKRGSGRVGGQ